MKDFKIVDEYGYGKDYSYLDKIIKRTLKLEKVKSANLSIVLIDDKTTDVLSFAFEDNNKICYNIRQLGEIYISIPQMIKQAKDYQHSEKRELAFLVVHGLLHLLGYDHTKGKEEEKIMFSKQELVLDEFKETKKAQTNEF